MRWSYSDYMALPADYVDSLQEWVNEREKALKQSQQQNRRR